VQSWNPHFSKDEEVLEKVQKRATKCVKGMKGKRYLERLHILVLTTLERSIRVDPIETFKILSGKENVDNETFFQLAESSRHTRGHSLKLYKRHCRVQTRLRKFLFSHSRQQLELLAATQHRSTIGQLTQLLQEAAG